MKQTKNLKLIVTSTSGYDHIDLKACQQARVRVAFAPDANALAASELTLSLMLALLRQTPEAQRLLTEGFWKNQMSRRAGFKGLQIGIIGFGRVGSRVAKVAQALDAKVFTYDPYIPRETIEKAGACPLGFTELLKNSDLLSLHTPLTEETYEMINAKTLELLSDEAFLVNTSRGAVIHEPALVESLQKNRLGGAALDVFVKEPLPENSPLRATKNLVMTPHIGAFTQTAFAEASMEAVEEVLRFAREEPLKNDLA